MPVEAADAAFVRDIIYRRAAISIDAAKDYLIESRLEPLAKRRGLPGSAELIQRARSGDASIVVDIVEAMATHETFFFRDGGPFDVLKQEVLPKLIAARAPRKSLTIWSAACSSGQEPYSLSMMLLDQFGPALEGWNVRIIATDLSEPILAKAKAGRFNQLEVNRGLPAKLMVRYFDRQGLDWIIKDEVKRRIDFRQLNLIEPWTIDPRPDVVLLRNVLIYFDVPTKRAILDRVRRSIHADGALFLGAAETTVNVADGWVPVQGDRSIYYRVKP